MGYSDPNLAGRIGGLRRDKGQCHQASISCSNYADRVKEACAAADCTGREFGQSVVGRV